MYGHLVLLLLAMAMASLQVCTAAIVQDGEYIFLLGSAAFVVYTKTPGIVGMITRNTVQFHTWTIENRENDAITISTRTPKGDRLYASPMEKADQSYVFVRETEFLWKLTQQEDKFIIGRADDDAASQLVLGAQGQGKFPTAALTGLLVAGNQNQLWKLVSVVGFNQEVDNHCGPWRLSFNRQ